MLKRGYRPNAILINKALKKRHGEEIALRIRNEGLALAWDKKIIYPEHNKKYYKECIENLKAKGINIE